MGDRIELKAFCSDPEAAAAAARGLGARASGTSTERDIYFHVHRVPRGRLLLRRTTGQPARLISYDLANQPGIHRTPSLVAELPAGDADAVEGVLAAANGVRVEVVKQRRTFRHKQFVVHLDQVGDLGSFVEVVVLADRCESAEAAGAVAGEARAALGIRDADVVAWTYADFATIQAAGRSWRQRLQEAAASGLVPGTLFLLDGPSGAGKTTIAQLLAERVPGLDFIRRYTSRPPRQTVTESEYVFVSCERFSELIAGGELIEFRDFEFQMSYGLPWQPVMDALLAGRDALGIINLGNVRLVKQVFPEARTILLSVAPDTLRRRLEARGKHNADEIAERLGNAARTDAYRPYYDDVVENREGKLPEVVDELAAHLTA